VNEVRTDNWVLRLPADWAPVDDGGQGFHFESGDGNKVLYIATHIIPPDYPSSVEELAEWFVAKDLETLDGMDGYAWLTMKRAIEPAPGSCAALLDRYAQAQDSRFMGKILSRPGQVVRASFQDHLCDGYAASQAYFAPILASLQLVAPQAPTLYH
jgi:hypothetical protein